MNSHNDRGITFLHCARHQLLGQPLLAWCALSAPCCPAGWVESTAGKASFNAQKPVHRIAEMTGRLCLSDKLVDELQAAVHLVIATPVYNYNVPASMEAWIDATVREGKTLGFDGHGRITGKKTTVLIRRTFQCTYCTTTGTSAVTGLPFHMTGRWRSSASSTPITCLPFTILQ